MKYIRRVALWLVFKGPRLPWGLAPWLMGIGVGARPVRMPAPPVAEQGKDGGE